MNLYKVLGLNLRSFTDTSYEVEGLYSDKILHDKQGKGIIKNHIFTEYTLYIIDYDESSQENSPTHENNYYAIHLSYSHRASIRGRLCSIGHMNIEQCIARTPDEFHRLITHVPIKPLVIKYDFMRTPERGTNISVRGLSGETTEEFRSMNEIKKYGYEDKNVCIFLYEDPYTHLCKFSYDGDSEINPCGYAYVNMDLFSPVTCLNNILRN